MRDSHTKIRSRGRTERHHVKSLMVKAETSPTNLTDCFFEHLDGRQVKRSSFITSLKQSSSAGAEPRRPSMIFLEGLDDLLSKSLRHDDSQPMPQLQIPLSLEDSADSLRAVEAEMDYIEALAPSTTKNTSSNVDVKSYQKMMMQLNDAYRATSRKRTPTTARGRSRLTLSAGDKDEAINNVEHSSCGRHASFQGTREEQSILSSESTSALRPSFAMDAPEFVAMPRRRRKNMLNTVETTSRDNDIDSFFDHMRGRAVQRSSFLTTLGERTRSSTLGERPRRPSIISMASICSMGNSTDEVLSTIAQLEIPGSVDDDNSLHVLQVHFDKVAEFRQGRKPASKK